MDGPAHDTLTPRLLPWLSPEGKPCYLSTGNGGGYLSRLADELEDLQLTTGTDVLGLARRVLEDPESPCTEVRYAGLRLAECLTDALRVAESRGMRLPAPGTEDTAGGEGARGQLTRNAGSGALSPRTCAQRQ
ncbi:conserved hypothetical protein [Streptomyces viridochromogenes DSM 40736]|uniref:Uncharacterized protein n=1 Tax=Streptomyces viridochromogenes (strain DSM 40736 / JCM 4977 / BCRC 1201 / Tue 494) TaxID=591159 RepID=D9WXP2_STRVT|nr:conserved hypothetical protein [Streptomyces viridochromogenes DSM 40736]